MSSKPKKVLFLYTELAGYIINCMEALAETGVDVYVIHWPVNAEAPFMFNKENRKCKYEERSKYSTVSLLAAARSIEPDMIVCSGWIDKGYLRVCRAMQESCRTVIALDNQPPKTLKGWLALARARMLYRPFFSHAWVPGIPQFSFARKLGFAKSAIRTGFYTIDVRAFKPFFGNSPAGPFPRRFVFTGRYVKSKGIEILWQAFKNANLNGFTLTCAGTGPLWEIRPELPGLMHMGFVQPAEMGTFVRPGGVFVLPSKYEPWGVVLHEFAACGYPLICSEAVGASSAFLESGKNGILVKPGNLAELKAALEWMASRSDQELWKMASHSAELGKKISAESWVQTALKLMD